MTLRSVKKTRESAEVLYSLTQVVLRGVNALNRIDHERYYDVIEQGDGYLEQAVSGSWYVNYPKDAQRFVNTILVPALLEAIDDNILLKNEHNNETSSSMPTTIEIIQELNKRGYSLPDSFYDMYADMIKGERG